MSKPQQIGRARHANTSNGSESSSYNESVFGMTELHHSISSPVSSSFKSGSPIYGSPSNTIDSIKRRMSFPSSGMKVLKPFDREDVKILLLENVATTGQEIFDAQGYQVEFIKTSLSPDDLKEKIKDVHAIGIRSKTQITKEIIDAAKNLMVIGCFCIGTNQVDLDYASEKGIVVFNSPFSNSRSVAELMICEIIALARQLGDRSNEMHQGKWNKVSAGCWEIRGKTLGIVGYGHIGSQLSVLAESMGLRVIYYDILPTMNLGMSKQVGSLHDLLKIADFVTLHVPELPETNNLISSKEFAAMKQGAYLINASRGHVVDIPALIDASRSGKIAGAALDVYPNEPASNGPNFNSELNTWGEELRSLKNIILTPHIGGSTEEAQSSIGQEVADSLTRYINEGSSIGAVNFPEVALGPSKDEYVRILFVHKNVPGVLKVVNEILANHNVNKQFSDSRGSIAYVMSDMRQASESELKKIQQQLERTPHSLSVRILY